MPARAARENGFAVPDPAAAKPELAAFGTRAGRAVTARSSKTSASGLADERIFTHRDDLMAIGWALVKDRGPNTEEDQQTWVDFIAATGRSVAQYNKTYATAVIQAAQSNPESDKSGSHN